MQDHARAAVVGVDVGEPLRFGRRPRSLSARSVDVICAPGHDGMNLAIQRTAQRAPSSRACRSTPAGH